MNHHQIYRVFITRKEDILSVSTHFKKMKMDMHEKAATLRYLCLTYKISEHGSAYYFMFCGKTHHSDKTTNAESSIFQKYFKSTFCALNTINCVCVEAFTKNNFTFLIYHFQNKL